jgi:predicted transcriptional regulator
MDKPLTIQIPEDLEQQLIVRATDLNVSLETLILESLLQVVQSPDLDDTPKEEVLASLHRAFEDIEAGRVIPLEELWDSLDDRLT